MNSTKISPIINNYIRYNAVSTFFFGAGLCFVLEEKKYSHIPFIIFFPIAYGGYNIFKNRHIFISEKANKFDYCKKGI